MTSQKLKSARAVAVEVLNRCDPKKNYAGSILNEVRHETDRSQRATDLVFGTLRNRGAIDTVIAKFSGRPVKRIQGRLLNIIRVGTYEQIYCPSTEQYAIVNEAVINAKAAGGAKQSNFVNAVLRQIARHISNRQIALSEGGSKRTLPQSSETGCQFDTSFLPDSETSLTEYLSTVFSLPEWLIADWLDEFGEESTRKICFASNRRPSLYIRPNRLKTTIEALTEKLATAEVGFEITGDGEMIRIKSPRDVSRLPGFAEGHFTVQDITASMPLRKLISSAFSVRRSAARSTQNAALKFLDLCAAPGTKTTQLAEITGDSAKIIATDIDNRRLEMVRENISRLGIKSVDVVPYEQLFVQRSAFGVPRHAVRSTQHNNYDCVLLDVPCSNTGVLARRIEARYRINPETIKELAVKQGELLRTASEMVKPAGLICYSTCSIQQQENSGLINEFLKKNKNFTLESEQWAWPSCGLTLPSAEGFRQKASCGDHDGGYVAILTKSLTKI